MRNSSLAAKLVTLAMVSSMVASCSVRPKHEENNPPTTGTTGTPTTPNALATPVNPADPGPYKTVEFEGAECKLSRYPQGVPGGTLIQAQIGSDPKTFNWWAASDVTSRQLAGLMFPGLLNIDTFTGEVVPELAKEITTGTDKVTYTMKLRKGLKWSDGQPFTADDVKFTFDKIIAAGLGNTSIRDGLLVDGKMPTVTVIDPLTVQFKTAKPFVPFMRSVGISIAPKHVVEPIISKGDARKKFEQLWSTTDPNLKSSLVTLGGFKLSNFTPSQRVEFERTDNFYYVDPSGKKRLPYLDRLVYLVVPDVNTNLFKFKGGETDIAGIRAKDAAGLQGETAKLNCKLYNLGPNTSTQFIMFNMNRRKNDKGKPYVTPYKSAWFNDVNFRQAINHAINRQNVIQGYLRGIGAPAWGCEPVVSPFFDKDLKQIDQDLTVSEKLLAQSGFSKGKDGKLRDKDGHPVELTLLYGAGGTFSEALANSLETDLRKLGIKLNYQAVDWNVLIDKVDSAKDWEMALYGLSGDPLDPHSGTNVWKSDGRLHLFDEREAGPNGTIVVKDARPWEKEIDAIFEEGAQEFDPVKRKAIYNRYQQIIYDQVPLIYLVTPMTIVAARNSLHNYVPNKLSQDSLGLHNVEELWKEGAK